MLKIYHNTRCGKSRCALQTIEKSGQPVEVVDYLKNPPTEAELRDLLALLGKKPLELIRQKEPIFQEKFKDQNHTDEEWIKIMITHPILIERPIVVFDGKAWVARDEQSLEEIEAALGD
ncbi:MAG: arsenate reductase (glutaredoxin) [Lewinellaceae bacterium]|nr:arsenate reductase (glutaredoxin) [Lewinellaceae bacterium]